VHREAVESPGGKSVVVGLRIPIGLRVLRRLDGMVGHALLLAVGSAAASAIGCSGVSSG
jgi:hypothetical protein